MRFCGLCVRSVIILWNAERFCLRILDLLFSFYLFPFSIVEVQSDKASVNIQCAADGTVTKVHWEEGDTVKVGEALVDIDYEGEVPGGSDEKEEESKTEEKSVQESQDPVSQNTSVSEIEKSSGNFTGCKTTESYKWYYIELVLREKIKWHVTS